MTRVLLIDDHVSYREAFAFMLEQDPGFEVVAQAGSLAEVRATRTPVDVAIVDLGLPDGNGSSVVADVLALNSSAIVIVLTASVDKKDFAAAVEAGATGVLSKSMPIRDIINAVHEAASGALLHSPAETIALLRLASQERQRTYAVQQTLERLTPRERDVLLALADGLSDREIGERLSISTETVRTHFVNILGKLHLTSRLQALVFAVRHGLVTLE